MPRLQVKPDERRVDIETGESVLAALRREGLPITSVCDGNARCSTCRVRVEEGIAAAEPRNEAEAALAGRLSFTPDVRLACQMRVRGDATIRRLALDADDTDLIAQAVHGAGGAAIGQERRLAILFSDIRGFTAFSEHLPPYDVIHVLDRYFNVMGRVVERHRGRVDNYIGDGMLAVFGEHGDADDALDAVAAGLEMLDQMRHFQDYTRRLYGKVLDMGIGIHWGDAVVGALGTPTSRRVTVIGDAVNFASRIEAANRAAGTRLLVSEDVRAALGRRVVVGCSASLSVKGKSGVHVLYEITGLPAGDGQACTSGA